LIIFFQAQATAHMDSKDTVEAAAGGHAVTVEDITTKKRQFEIEQKAEHDLTLGQIFRHYPALVWWCFYWAMAAVGW
jgi:hypothetical protein